MTTTAGDADTFSDAVEDGEEEAMCDLQLEVDLDGIGELLSLVLAGAQKRVLNASAFMFQSIQSYGTLPKKTYLQHGILDSESVSVVMGMVGSPLWKSFYGEWKIRPSNWVPIQVVGILRHQLAALAAQMTTDQTAVDAAKARIVPARSNATLRLRARKSPYQPFSGPALARCSSSSSFREHLQRQQQQLLMRLPRRLLAAQPTPAGGLDALFTLTRHQRRPSLSEAFSEKQGNPVGSVCLFVLMMACFLVYGSCEHCIEEAVEWH